MAIRKPEAVWRGTLKEGNGTMKLASGLYEGPFTFSSRFEEAKGTNPEELIGAAHAGCSSMFLSTLLTEKGYKPTRIRTTAAVHLGAGPLIRKDGPRVRGRGARGGAEVQELAGSSQGGLSRVQGAGGCAQDLVPSRAGGIGGCTRSLIERAGRWHGTRSGASFCAPSA